MASFEQWARLRHFQLAVAIAENGSILRAAGALGLSQPTASKLLQDLEDSLHAPLFFRGNRGVEPTELGREFVRHARVILAQLGQTSMALQALSTGASGTVALGTLLAASSHLLPTTLLRLRRTRPNISLRIVEGTNDHLMPRLLSGELDLVLGRLSQIRHRNDVDQEPLLRDAFAVVSRRGHPLAGRAGVPLHELLGFDWILPPPETTLRRQFEALFHDAGLNSPPAAIESISFLTNHRLLLDSDMLGVWPRPVIDHGPDRDGLTTILPAAAFPVGTIGISRRKGTLLSPAAEAVAAELRATAAELYPDEAGDQPKSSSSV
ncbi:LysR family transcriptional regulator [Sphingomonas histidinilytica]|uniref:Transcriptional regulator, LysR family n=1 Tax=Rhizorhabdus histidinilytica TaxID=439228 RepID=A0A1T5AJ52_9SPHN|nr:LysR substrate-binding domain-containing protein [Rhizorhabdus histidinilytica]MBO9376750.1 LysR family transcriptional regulator [Rhizorhabdus histidinilytica]SKB34920.1 transcriptional regulator, LysR family [Rhizorhabdus histidinilytica]